MNRLEIELQTREQRAGSGQLRVKIERVEFVILIADVQQSELDFGHAPRKAVTDEGIKLPEIIAGQGSRIACIGLSRPDGFHFAEEAARVVKESVKIYLLQGGADVAVRAQADRELAPYRSKMPPAQVEQLQKQYLHKKLLEKYKLPRLSLFYMH